MAATEPIRDNNQFKALAEYFLHRGKIRNYAMVIIGAYTALRISDLLCLKWSDVYDEQRREFCSHITVTERKTRKTKTIALNNHILAALKIFFSYRQGDFMFASRRDKEKPISRVQAWRIINGAVRRG